MEESTTTNCFQNSLKFFVATFEIIFTFDAFVWPYLKLLVDSFVGFTKVFTTKKRHQNKRLLHQLGKSDTDSMMGQDIHDVQNESRGTIKDRIVTLSIAKISAPVDGS